MFLLIRKGDGAVMGVNYNPVHGEYNEQEIEIKEWFGPEPATHLGDPFDSQPSYDPTISEHQTILRQAKRDFAALGESITNEIAWLTAAIPLVNNMTVVELKIVLKRVLRENRSMLKAWRYVVSKGGE